MLSEELERKFWSQVDKCGPMSVMLDGRCWEWLGSKSSEGAAIFAINRRQKQSKRMTWELCVGPIPDRHFVCHACENKACVNPDHMVLSTDRSSNHMRVRGQTIEERFWSRVNKNGPVAAHVPDIGQCWLWTAGTGSGYGSFYFNGKRMNAHVVAKILHSGPGPIGTEGCHRCDNTLCCNPDHIFWGTHAENMEDCTRKGRHPSGDDSWFRKHPECIPRGSSRPCSKLTESDIPTIRDMRKRGKLFVEIAKEYGVNPTTVSDICFKRKWKHVPDSDVVLQGASDT